MLIAGLGGKGAFWQPVVSQLKTSKRVLSFDHPGVGGSSLVGKPTIEGIAQAVLQLLDEKDIACAHIVGHSTGSLVAQTLALDYPERVESAVLSSGWAKPDQRFLDFFAYRRYVLNELGGEAYRALTELTAWPSEWYESNFAGPETRRFSGHADVDKGSINDRIEMLLSYSRMDDLHALKACDVLIIGAADDYIIPFVHGKHLHSLIPHSRLVELNGGHFAPVIHTGKFVEILNSFWETIR
ncbi:alpha/beta hydrolase [Acerihabitans sp. KWT182]|uniref:Alpha/beta hydrolase n=1 Tax=Acerihabitans sp. KWT182 TaxID=3157919 RepID=A0AAU7QBB8_9GAMM